MNTGELTTDLLTRLGDDPTLPNETYYTRSEAVVALNQAYRMVCFFTLCLEATVTFTWPASTTFLKMLGQYADWTLPLKIRLVNGAKLRPNRFAELAALDASWSKTTGTPERYALGGFDLLGMYKTPTQDTPMQIVYARNPAPLVLDADVPELQTEYHQSLIDLATPLLRIKEGAQEWQKTLPMWDRGMAAIQKLADYVRARNKEQGYDRMPVELARFDKSKLMEMATNGR